MAPPAGVRVRTRLHLTEDEAAALGEVGEYLGSAYRRELAHRISMGRLDSKAHAVWRAERKQAVTAVASSRWAGAITRAVQDQYQLGMRALTAQVADLPAAIAVLERRCWSRPAKHPPQRRMGRVVRGDSPGGPRAGMPVRRSGSPRPEDWPHAGRLVRPTPRWRRGARRSPWAVIVSWRTRQNLAAAEMTEQQWRGRWTRPELFLTADGESGKAGGYALKRSGSTLTASCGSKSLSPWPTGSVRICTSPHLWCSTTAAMSGATGFVIGERCATTSPSTRSVAAGIWTRLDNYPGSDRRARQAARRPRTWCGSQR